MRALWPIASLYALDPWVADRRDTPLWFVELKAAQMPVAVMGLVGVVVLWQCNILVEL